MVPLLRLASNKDVTHVYQVIKSCPDFCEDVNEITPEFISSLIENCTVFVGDDGVFVSDEITNAMCRVHPLWNGEDSTGAMEQFLSKLPYNVACGFVPEKRKHVARYFEKCGFEKVGTLNRSIFLSGELQNQTVYQREL